MKPIKPPKLYSQPIRNLSHLKTQTSVTKLSSPLPPHSFTFKRFLSFDLLTAVHTIVNSKEFLGLITGLTGFIIRDHLAKRKDNTIKFTLAAQSHQKEIPDNIERLIDTANINLRDGHGNTALHYTCTTGNLELAKIMFLHGCRLDIQNNAGDTALFNAAFHGHTLLIKEFVKAITQYNTGLLWRIKNIIFETTIKSMVNKKNYRSWTPFIAAAFNNHTQTAIYLHHLGAELTISNDNGETGLYWAVMNNDITLVRYILFHAGLTQDTIDELLSQDIPRGIGTPLHAAANQGHVEITRLILEAAKTSTEYNIKNIRAGKYSRTALHEAALRGNYEIVDLLLQYGANPALELKDGRTPLDLLLISSSGQHSIDKRKDFSECLELIASRVTHSIEYLHTAKLVRLEHFKRVFSDIITVENIIGLADTFTDDQQNTLMHCLAIGNSPELISMLAEYNPNLINKPNKFGSTPLYEATAFGSFEAAERLLALGADINTPRHGGWTPLCVAALANNYKIMKFMLENYRHQINNVDQRNNWGETPFYWAIQHNNLEAVQLLATHGTSLNQVDNNGHNCLHHLAKIQESAAIVTYLLNEHKIPINQPTNKHFNTPTHTAAKYHNEVFIEIISKYTAGAGSFYTNGSGKTPEQLTTNHKVKKLLAPGADIETPKPPELKR